MVYLQATYDLEKRILNIWNHVIFIRENINIETYRCIRVYVLFKHYQILDKHPIIDIFLSRPHLTSLVHKTNKR